MGYALYEDRVLRKKRDSSQTTDNDLKRETGRKR